MMSFFIAQRVVIGKVEFKAVPDKLKPLVYAELEKSGLEFLAGEYKPE